MTPGVDSSIATEVISATSSSRGGVKSADDRPTRFRVTLTVLVALGVAVRIALWLRAPDLWLDEAMIAVSFVADPLRDLLGTRLRFEQSIPPLFAFLTWGSTTLFGTGELAFRLPALLGSIAFLAVFAMAAYRWLPFSGAIVAVTLACFGAAPVRYALELKSHGFDLLVAVVLVSLALTARAAPLAPSSWVRLGVASVIASLLSFGTPFVVASIGLALLLDPSFRATRVGPVGLAGAVTAGMIAAVAIQIPIQTDARLVDYLATYWRGDYASADLGRFAVLHSRWIADALIGNGDGTRAVFGLLVSCLAVAGLGWIRQRAGWWGAGLLAFPLVLAYVASSFGRLPVHFRLLEFTLPGLLVLTGAGIARLVALGRSGRLAAAIAALTLVTLPIADAIRLKFALAPDQPVGRFLRDPEFQTRHDEPTYVFTRATPAFLVYGARHATADLTQLRTIATMAERTGPNSGNAPSRNRRVVDEGFDQRFDLADHRYLIGIASGFQQLHHSLRTEPDPGWAENEVARVEAEGKRCAWFLLAGAFFETPHLVRALEDRGWRETRARRGSNTSLSRYCRDLDKDSGVTPSAQRSR